MITKPLAEETTDYMKGYVDVAPGTDLISSLKESMAKTLGLFKSVDPHMGDYKYAEGKWSIKEVLGHIIDTERIFAYRALTFARNDSAALPGYDQDAYVPHSNAANRHLQDMIKEYELVRLSSILLFESFSSDMLDKKGLANNFTVTPRIIGWMMAGHDAHHYKVLATRYLNNATV